MMPQHLPITVELCMGSSCYSRGNRTLAAEVEEIITRRGWTDVQMRGRHCQNQCAAGPHVNISGVACTPTMAAIEQRIGECLSAWSEK